MHGVTVHASSHLHAEMRVNRAHGPDQDTYLLLDEFPLCCVGQQTFDSLNAGPRRSIKKIGST